LEEVIAFAERLVGHDRLRRALADPSIEEQIRRDVQIYQVTFQKLGEHSLPQLIVGTNFTTGAFSRNDILLELIGNQLGRHQ